MSVAIALGLGTMVSWNRIVVTVGERIGKQHLTYAQGASAEIVAAGTILGAEYYGLPVSITLTSSLPALLAPAFSAQEFEPSSWGTVRAIVLAWVLTLPAAMAIAGGLYFLFRRVL